jgi:hypothetical protein
MDNYVLDAAYLLAHMGREQPLADPEWEGVWSGHPGLRAVRLIYAALALTGERAPWTDPESLAAGVGYDQRRLFDIIARAREVGDAAARAADTAEDAGPDDVAVIGPSRLTLARIALRAAAWHIAQATGTDAGRSP